MTILVFLLIIINAAAIVALRAELRGRFEDDANALGHGDMPTRR